MTRSCAALACSPCVPPSVPVARVLAVASVCVCVCVCVYLFFRCVTVCMYVCFALERSAPSVTITPHLSQFPFVPTVAPPVARLPVAASLPVSSPGRPRDVAVAALELLVSFDHSQILCGPNLVKKYEQPLSRGSESNSRLNRRMTHIQRTHTRAYIHSNTHTHTKKHARTHTYIHTHTHTHARCSGSGRGAPKPAAAAAPVAPPANAGDASARGVFEMVSFVCRCTCTHTHTHTHLLPSRFVCLCLFEHHIHIYIHAPTSPVFRL